MMNKRIEHNISKAEALTNPLQTLQLLASFETTEKYDSSSSGGETSHPKRKFRFQFYRAPLPSDLHDACMNLFEENMGEFYRSSSWGLDLDEKTDELRHESARFLIVTQDDDDISSSLNTTSDASSPNNTKMRSSSRAKICAFSHFRFEVNDDDFPTEEVLYVYEIQVSPDLQKCGIGKRCMSIMELIALQANMRRVMLTAFKSNQGAMKFYIDKMKYGIDSSSPSNFDGEEVDYEILSKSLMSKQTKGKIM